MLKLGSPNGMALGALAWSAISRVLLSRLGLARLEFFLQTPVAWLAGEVELAPSLRGVHMAVLLRESCCLRCSRHVLVTSFQKTKGNKSRAPAIMKRFVRRRSRR